MQNVKISYIVKCLDLAMIEAEVEMEGIASFLEHFYPHLPSCFSQDFCG